MKETIELRVVNEFSNFVFPENEGKVLGSGLIRQVRLASSDPRVARVGEMHSELVRTRNRSFFHGWEYHRRYSQKELAVAELFQLHITAFCEPDGIASGAIYDESKVCSHCGAGRRLIGNLFLDLGNVPKGKDFVQSIAGDEWIVSERLVGLMREQGMIGVRFEPVLPLKKQRVGNANWYRLDVTGPPVEATQPTRFGIDPFDDDLAGRYRCSKGHVAGLNILSELSVVRSSWSGADIAITHQMVGNRQGVLVPRPLIVVSPRLRALLIEHDIKGYRTEVAYLV